MKYSNACNYVLFTGEHACSIKDSDGNLPLHLACHYNAPSQILKELIETYPDAAYRVNNDGELPLHLLVQCESGNLSHTRRQAVQLMCSSINYSPGVLRYVKMRDIVIHTPIFW